MKKIERLLNTYTADMNNKQYTDEYRRNRVIIAKLLKDYEQSKMLHFTTEEFINTYAATYDSVNDIVLKEI